MIENAIGRSGDDPLIGNEADNILSGAGDDSFIDQFGDDIFHGGSGSDTVIYNLNFAAFRFTLLQDAIRVIGEGVDLVYDTVEQLQFLDAAYSFSQITALFGNTAPIGDDDTATVTEGSHTLLNGQTLVAGHQYVSNTFGFSPVTFGEEGTKPWL